MVFRGVETLGFLRVFSLAVAKGDLVAVPGPEGTPAPSRVGRHWTIGQIISAIYARF
jgi:hypothetical protein